MSTQNRGNFPEIGARLKAERKRLSLSQEALCELIGLKDPKTLRSWESGTTAPTLFDLLEFERRGADVVYIVTGDKGGSIARKPGSDYETPAVVAARGIAAMTLSQEDAELVLALAKRLAQRGK